jgi:hypothetical protein
MPKRNHVSQDLAVAVWNIDGLKSSLNEPDFINNIKCFDIVILVETHITQPVHINSEYVYHKLGKKFSNKGRASGGISIIIKNELKKGIKILENKNDCFVWLQLEKTFFNLEKDTFICAAYIPPENSSIWMHRNEDPFQTLDEEVGKYQCKGNVAIMGDLNAYTGNAYDFIPEDHVDFTGMSEDLYNIDYQVRKRVNMDLHRPNNYGKDLINLCIKAQMRILNGRTLGDLEGKLTHYGERGYSVIDYSIIQETLLSKVMNFKVHPQRRLVSKHCMISTHFALDIDKGDNAIHQTTIFPKGFKWNNESSEMFYNTITSPNTQMKIDQFNEEHFSDCNKCCDELVEIFIESAETTLKRKRKIHKKKNDKPWHDKDLKQMKKDLHNLENLLSKFPKDPVILGMLKTRYKIYKKECKHKQKVFKDNLMTQIQSLDYRNPEQFWNLIQKMKRNKSQNEDQKIPLQLWNEYFKDLHSNKTDHTFDDKFKHDIENIMDTLEVNEEDDNILNTEITTKEISENMKDLKNGKAHGTDEISHEMLKATKGHVNSCLAKLFNFILSQKDIPNEWCKGYIVPIHKSGPVGDPANYRGITISSCLGKVFMKIINNIITKFMLNKSILTT